LLIATIHIDIITIMYNVFFLVISDFQRTPKTKVSIKTTISIYWWWWRWMQRSKCCFFSITKLKKKMFRNQNLNFIIFWPFFYKVILMSSGVFDEKLDEVLGTFAVELDGRFSSVRTSETNLGNWICDVVLAATNSDCVIINSGTLRSDTVHPAGDFTIRDLTQVIPMMDPLVVLSVTG